MIATRAAGNFEDLEPLGGQFDREQGDPRHVARRPGQVRDETSPDGVADADEHDGNRAGRPGRREGRRRAHGKDEVRLVPHQIGGKLGEPVVIPLGKAGIDHVAARSVAPVAQAVLERRQERRSRRGRAPVEVADTYDPTPPAEPERRAAQQGGH
jgi:hypothetical protein